MLQRGPGCEARSVDGLRRSCRHRAGASTRSGLRSPECPTGACVIATEPPGLQRGPGCEARSVPSAASAISASRRSSFNEVRAAKPGVSAARHGQRACNRQASTRSGLRSPECLHRSIPTWRNRTSFNEVRAAKPGVSRFRTRRPRRRPLCFNEVRAAKPGVSRPNEVCWATSSQLQRGPGCEARSVGRGKEGRPRRQQGFNEVRAAKPGVSLSSSSSSSSSSRCFNEVRAAKPGVSIAGCSESSATWTCFNEVRAAKPGVSVVPALRGFGGAVASTRSGLRSPECQARRLRSGDHLPALQRGPGCEARSVAADCPTSTGAPRRFNEVRAAKPGVSPDVRRTDRCV